MTSFDSLHFEGSKFSVDEAIDVDKRTVGVHTHRIFLRMLCALFGIGSAAALLMPWVTFEVPMSGRTSAIYPWVFVGGRAFTIVYILFVVAGLTALFLGKTKGVLLMAIPAATVAWFALAVAIFGSIFHSFLGVFGFLAQAVMLIDTGDPGAWVRQGQGLILSIVCGLAVGVIAVLQFEPLCRTTWLVKKLFASLITTVSLFILLASSQNTWVVASVVGRDLRIQVQGDQIFGSALIDGLIWVTVGIWILSVLAGYEGIQKLAQIMTVTVAVLRLVQCGFVLASASLFESALPGSIQVEKHVERLSGLYLTMGLSIVLIPLAFSSAFSKRIRVFCWGLISLLISGGLVLLALSN